MLGLNVVKRLFGTTDPVTVDQNISPGEYIVEEINRTHTVDGKVRFKLYIHESPYEIDTTEAFFEFASIEDYVRWHDKCLVEYDQYFGVSDTYRVEALPHECPDVTVRKSFEGPWVTVEQ